MSSLPYAKLLCSVYQVPKAQAENIAHLLTAEDKVTIRAAIAALETKPSGYRLPEIINRYFGIDGEPTTMIAIGATLDVPISASYVQQLRTKAEFYLRKATMLQPVAARLCAAGVTSHKLEIARNMLTPEKLEALQVAAATPPGDTAPTKGNFILDCFPDCAPDNPCPSCRARTLFAHQGILDETILLAQEWLSGPRGDWRSTSIQAVGFSVRTVNCLLNEHLYTLGLLCTKSEAELMQAPNFGRRSLIEIKEFLESLGKQLRPH